MAADWAMRSLTITLVTEGGADRALIYVIEWLTKDMGINARVVYPDLGRYPGKLSSMAERIVAAIDMDESCDILCIHRDADGDGVDARKCEILSAIGKAKQKAGPGALQFPIDVCIIPVRETEAWFLINEDAILFAAAAKNKSVKLPRIGDIENISQPKKYLYEMLKKASGASGRKLKKIRPQESVHRVAELISDYSPLRKLSAFQKFEKDFRAACEKWKGTN